MRDLLVPNKGGKREKLELKEDPNKGVYIKVQGYYELGESRDQQ